MTIFGTFAKLRKAVISFAMSVRPSVYPYGTNRLSLHGFSSNWTFEEFSKICRDDSFSLICGKNKVYFTQRPMFTYDNNSPTFFRMRNISDEVSRSIKTYILHSAIVSRKLSRL